jgi:hypothetical protein
LCIFTVLQVFTSLPALSFFTLQTCFVLGEEADEAGADAAVANTEVVKIAAKIKVKNVFIISS